MTLLSLIAIYLLLVLKPLFFQQISAHRMTVDLSYKMDAKIMKWITARPYELRILSREKKTGNQTIRIQSDEIFMATHTGTHLDAPIHFGAIVDVVDNASHQLDYLVTVRDLNEWEKINGKILEDSVIIIRTGWSKKWPNKLEYFGTETNDPKQAHFPGLHPKAAEWLVKQRQIVGVGIDSPSIDCGQCDGKGSHIILNSNNIYILENIEKSIFILKPTGSTITILPLKLSNASGCPVRPIVEYNQNDDHHDESF
ncbi:hypothetical protein DERP_009874 [Dermatophagoides pteronyssinus]|uniref:Kynurenine formamidase-like n=1 Tax=Dermatophagoides pteronyssinus TaxID=6956 RepID=A0ABQ8J1S4_DERPT|nr:hypothetical protein DERP_009874 [Dermatophagoides pteronyssinus]